MDLFSETRRLEMADADVVYHPAPELGFCADSLLQRLRRDLAWEQHSVRIRDKIIPQPRLSSWYGDVVHTYSTLAHVLVPHPWTDMLNPLRQRVQTLAGSGFNSMLANLYRSGDDCIGWHSDNEPELGLSPTIASLSLGAERRFALRRKDDHTVTTSLILEHGSLLIMAGSTQKFWDHTVARTRMQTGERINLTFRLTAPMTGGHATTSKT